jgi:hypothetical protein
MLVIKQDEQKKENKKEHYVIYKVQGKRSWWVQRESDPNLFCRVQMTIGGFGIIIEGDCPDAIYRKRLCKHCKWVIEKYQLGVENVTE